MKILRLATFLLFVSAICLHVAGQGTAFTYQGVLNSGGAPANGSYDIQFTLYTTNVTGGPLAGPVTNSATSVSNGLFTAVVDFGPGVFNGQPLWLDVSVSPAGSNTFTELTPRQPITSTPYAAMAGGASNLLGTLPAAALPPVVVTNGETGVNLSGTFSGNGSGLTSLPAAVVTNHASNVTLAGTFTGNNANLNGTFSGNGSGLSLPGNVVTYGENSVTLGGNFSGNFSGSFSGNGSELSSLPGNVVITGENGVALNNGFFSGTFSGSGNFSGTHSGNGSGLTNLNASSLDSTLAATNFAATTVTNFSQVTGPLPVTFTSPATADDCS
jgi:hypothetical protein